MRIGFDARIAYYSRGGIHSYVVHLLDALAATDGRTDYRILRSRWDAASPAHGANFRHVACWTPSHHRLERWALGLEIARLNLELLHSPDFIPPGFGYDRSVITVHDLSFLYYPRFLNAESRRYYNEQIDWAVQRTDHILADSYATRSDLISLLQVPPDKITVVHLAANPCFSPVPDGEARQVVHQYALQPGFILFVGTLEPRKNIPGLLHAYRMLLDSRVTAQPLVLVGDKGWLYEEILAAVEALGLSDQVRFLDRVPSAHLPALYSAADVLAMPSFYEGFGLPALEAMACGTPVIVADRASLPEVVGEAGELVDPDDPGAIAGALTRVLTEEPLRVEMGKLGLERAATFSWDRVARETLKVYRQVLGV